MEKSGELELPDNASAPVACQHRRQEDASMICLKFTEIARGSLKGFADLELANGFILHDCKLMETGSGRWVSLPSRQLLDKDKQPVMKDGKAVYVPVVSIADKTRRELFSNTALAAIDNFRAAAAPAPAAPALNEIPW
jgi:DNA-binding cell septation regulator SpoVG